jgi:hypothetical protein
MLSGSFFPHAQDRFARVKLLFFHENNGFIVGTLLSLIGSVFAGRFMLSLAPLAGFAPVLLLVALGRAPAPRPGG